MKGRRLTINESWQLKKLLLIRYIVNIILVVLKRMGRIGIEKLIHVIL